MPKPTESDFVKKLVVEGVEDKLVIAELVDPLENNVFIANCDGKDNIQPKLNTLIANPTNNNIIGVVLDADEDINTVWASYRSFLARHNLNLPENPSVEGTIISNDLIKLGIWVMPNNSLSGMLEDFVKLLIDDEDLLVNEAESVLKLIETKKINKYNQRIHRSKAFIHTWLAWQTEPGRSMAVAISQKNLNKNNPNSLHFKNWFNLLFEL